MSSREPNESHEQEPAKGQFLIYQAEDGRLKLDVRFEDGSVWLTQPLMAELFKTTQQNISQHILNIYEEEELASEATHKKFLSVRLEGKREVKRLLDYYNLVEQYLIFAQGQAMRRIPMHMSDWIKKLDSFMTLNDRDILTNAGKISHEMAKQLAEGEYEKFHASRLSDSANTISDFDKAVKQIEASKKKKGNSHE